MTCLRLARLVPRARRALSTLAEPAGVAIVGCGQIMTHHAYTSLYLMGESPTSVSAMKATINDGSVEQENLAVVMMQMPS